MTNYQQTLFTDLVDVNWLINEHKDDKEMRRFLSIAYHKIQDDLRESMGDDKYNNFIRAGREMFAPAKG